MMKLSGIHSISCILSVLCVSQLIFQGNDNELYALRGGDICIIAGVDFCPESADDSCELADDSCSATNQTCDIDEGEISSGASYPKVATASQGFSGSKVSGSVTCTFSYYCDTTCVTAFNLWFCETNTDFHINGSDMKDTTIPDGDPCPKQ